MQLKPRLGAMNPNLRLGWRFAPRRLALLATLLLAACGGSSNSCSDVSPAPTVSAPPPAPRAEPIPKRTIRQLQNDGFSIGYDTQRRRAAWVAFCLTPVGHFHSMPRPKFRPDPRLAKLQDLRIYAGSAYERGHMAPNYAISQLYGVHAQRETFYYSNIEPQTPRLNELLWQRLEEIEIDDIAPQVHTLWVVTGPIPAADGGPPMAFYRIWLAKTHAGHWAMLAFRIPQRVRGDERLDRYIVSVDAIEAATGLNFFSKLPVAAQKSLESQPAPASTFGFAQYACAPARYGGRWQDRDGIHLRYNRCGH
jgi:endonuclease G